MIDAGHFGAGDIQKKIAQLEATSDLDSAAEREVQKTLAELRTDRTIVTIAHRLSTISTADRILVLDGGRIVERGSHAELLELNGDYAHLWELQSGGPAPGAAGPSAEP